MRVCIKTGGYVREVAYAVVATAATVGGVTNGGIDGGIECVDRDRIDIFEDDICANSVVLEVEVIAV